MGKKRHWGMVPPSLRYGVASPPSLYCGVAGKQVSGGGKRQRTGALQDAPRRRGHLRPAGQTREILNPISPNGRDTGNSGNTGFIEHTSLSRRLAKPSRQTREIAAYRQTSRIIVNQSCLESCYISKESCIIVLNRVKNKESFFQKVPRVRCQVSGARFRASGGRVRLGPDARFEMWDDINEGEGDGSEQVPIHADRAVRTPRRDV